MDKKQNKDNNKKERKEWDGVVELEELTKVRFVDRKDAESSNQTQEECVP